MKIRNGFVSNSSSSSFCIYGTNIDFDKFASKIKESNFLSLSEEQLDELVGNWELCEMVEGKTELSIYQDDYNVWIGRSWSTVGDDETGKEFKNSVETGLEKILGSTVECRTYEEEIYNG